VHRYIAERRRHRPSLWPALQDRAQLQTSHAPDRFIRLPIFCESSLSVLQCLLAFTLLMFVNGLIVRLRIEVSHSVEIRADAMIVDGEDVFYAQDIGDNWPELQMKDDDPDRMVICGICGTRFIEYMTANRLDKNDRTPEMLAADLQAAIEQLWGRREVTFATAM
jgi:hypothetical protein